MKSYKYKTKGTCSSAITFDIEEGKVYNVQFYGGCNGNLKGISALSEGMDAALLAEKLSSITCGFKNTSCPHQLSLALKAALAEE
ncbi:MAG: TIGR03905 family TSCPD domain-containing protein [Clostridia bacterium]|nr:TIGR03905 family TSCPD domain-containing protein [Clostridia bacterium]